MGFLNYNKCFNFQLKELYTLLNENYVEDDDNMFRFDYSPEFLRWALLPPGFLQEWHVGVRAKKSKKMVGFISAVPATISIYKKVSYNQVPFYSEVSWILDQQPEYSLSLMNIIVRFLSLQQTTTILYSKQGQNNVIVIV